jgi:hypothetical protein
MAVWQFDLHLVPEAHLHPANWRQQAVDDLVEWRDVQPPSELAVRLSELLPQSSSWNSNIRRWGAEDGTRIDVHATADRIDGIFVRIDARAVNRALLEGISALAEYCRGTFLTPDGLEVRPSADALEDAIVQSRAGRFVANPDAYLRSIQEN